MVDGSRLPSVFSYGQAIAWIASSIGRLMSFEHLAHEMWHLDGGELGIEPGLNLVITRLKGAKTDDPAPPEPIMSTSDAVERARAELYAALCAGRVTMTGHPSWEPANVIRTVEQAEFTSLRFCEDSQEVTTAKIRTNTDFFWTTIRFSRAGIESLWPFPTPPAPMETETKPDVEKNDFAPEEAKSDNAIPAERASRKRGPKSDLGRRIRQAMRSAVAQGYDLAHALEKELPSRFGGGRTSCRQARDEVLAEAPSWNSDKLRETTNSDNGAPALSCSHRPSPDAEQVDGTSAGYRTEE